VICLNLILKIIEYIILFGIVVSVYIMRNLFSFDKRLNT